MDLFFHSYLNLFDTSESHFIIFCCCCCCWSQTKTYLLTDFNADDQQNHKKKLNKGRVRERWEGGREQNRITQNDKEQENIRVETGVFVFRKNNKKKEQQINKQTNKHPGPWAIQQIKHSLSLSPLFQ